MKPLLSIITALFLTGLLHAQTPNIIVVLVDDMGYGDIKAYQPAAKTFTPNLDSMVAAGMRFTDFHTNSAVCTPTRYGLLTGRYAWRTRLKSGVLDGSKRRLIDATRDTIPKLLKRKNYRTANIGKWHLGMTETDGLTNIYTNSSDAQRQLGTNDVGFDYWYGIPASLDHIPYCIVDNGNLVNMTDDSDSPAYSTWPTQPASSNPRFIRSGKIAPGFDFEKLMARMEVKVKDFITDHEANHSSQPFFIYHPLPAPHAPWVPDFENLTVANSPSYFGYSITQTEVDNLKNASPATRELAYIAYVNQIDRHMGSLIAHLNDPNDDGNTADSITNDTLIIFTSDNGADSSSFSENATHGYEINHGWRGQKADIHEAGHRVPFIAKWPGQIAANSISNESVCMTDIFATIAEIVDQSYSVDAGADSYSIKKVLLGESFTSPIRGPIVHHSFSGMFAIREGDWKLIFGTGSGGFSGAAGEGSNTKTDNTPQRLYNLSTNPSEAFAQNQLSAETAVVTDLHTKLNAIRDNPRSAPHPDLLDDDGDGMNNGFENLHGLDKDDPSDANIDGSDNDGLTNLQEFNLGTDPTKADSDGDRIPDGVEDANQNGVVDAGESDPAKADTDGDGIDDFLEFTFGSDFNDGAVFPNSVVKRGESLILDEFDNGNVATANAGENGGVQIVKNGVASGESLSEAASLLTIDTGSGSSGNVGAASLTPIDFASSTKGIRLTWEIDSVSARPQANGLFLGFSSGTGFYRSSPNLGFVFFGKAQTGSVSGFSIVRNDSDSPVGTIIDSGEELDIDSLLDGFTATLVLTPTGFSYSLTGLRSATGTDTVFTNSSTWVEAGLAANFYSTLGNDERLLSSVQMSTGALELKLSKIKAEKIVNVPFDLSQRFTTVTGTPAVALIWNSELAKTYALDISEDLDTWTEVETEIQSTGNTTGWLYENAQLPPAGNSKVKWFFRIREE